MSSPAILRFGSFELDARSAELRKDGALVRLVPQPVKLLGMLAQQSGQVVTREEIRRQIWSDGTFVDFDQGLNFCIRQMREALGDDASKPVFVETLPRLPEAITTSLSGLESLVVRSSMAASRFARGLKELEPKTGTRLREFMIAARTLLEENHTESIAAVRRLLATISATRRACSS